MVVFHRVPFNDEERIKQTPAYKKIEKSTLWSPIYLVLASIVINILMYIGVLQQSPTTSREYSWLENPALVLCIGITIAVIVFTPMILQKWPPSRTSGNDGPSKTANPLKDQVPELDAYIKVAALLETPSILVFFGVFAFDFKLSSFLLASAVFWVGMLFVLKYIRPVILELAMQRLYEESQKQG